MRQGHLPHEMGVDVLGSGAMSQTSDHHHDPAES